MKAAQDIEWHGQKRIFLLTDGMVKEPQLVEQQAKYNPDVNRIHTFGIGDDCDKDMVINTSIAGRGSCSLVSDNRTKQLNGKVIKALEHAFEPSLKQCTVQWGNYQPENLGEVFRNQMIYRTALVSPEEFQNFKFVFKSVEDPITGKPINLNYTKD